MSLLRPGEQFWGALGDAVPRGALRHRRQPDGRMAPGCFRREWEGAGNDAANFAAGPIVMLLSAADSARLGQGQGWARSRGWDPPLCPPWELRQGPDTLFGAWHPNLMALAQI